MSPTRSRWPRVLALVLVSLLPLAGLAEAPQPEDEAAISPAIDWRPFASSTLRRAQTEQRLILLVLDVPWSETSRAAEKTLWTNPDVTRLVRSDFVAVRERADLRPDLAMRYPAERWPAVSLLLPDGAPLIYDTADPQARRRVTAGPMAPSAMALLLERASAYYRAAPQRATQISGEFLQKIRETSRPVFGMPLDTMVWGVARALHDTFDEGSGYYGGPPRIPRFGLLELMLKVSGEEREPWRKPSMAALDTLTANLVDEKDGGLMRMALGIDWELPQSEKLLDRNARLLDLYADAFRLEGRKSYREQGLKTARFITSRLAAGGPSLANAVCKSCPDGRDEVVLTAPNARAALALIRAGAVFGDEELSSRGLELARFLRTERYRPGKLVPRAVVESKTYVPGNFILEDQVTTCAAFIAAYEATGDSGWLDAAGGLARATLVNFRDGENSALTDIIAQPGESAMHRIPLFPLDSNSEMIRVLVRLHALTGDRQLKARAREILGSFVGSFKDFPVQRDLYGLAAYEFFFAPVVTHVVAPAGDERAAKLRAAGLASSFPYAVVRSWDAKSDKAKLEALGLEPAAGASAIVARGEHKRPAVGSADGVAAMIYDLTVSTEGVRESAAGQAAEQPE